MINKIANGIADFVCDKKMHEKMIMNVLFWFMVMK